MGCGRGMAAFTSPSAPIHPGLFLHQQVMRLRTQLPDSLKGPFPGAQLGEGIRGVAAFRELSHKGPLRSSERSYKCDP